MGVATGLPFSLGDTGKCRGLSQKEEKHRGKTQSGGEVELSQLTEPSVRTKHLEASLIHPRNGVRG